MARAENYGIRVLGPNCQGIINTDPDVRAYCNFTFTKPDPGHISIVALSGGVAEVIHQGFSAMGVGTRIYASNGNACDITIPEIIGYLGDDDGTRVIVTYVEGLRDPATFMEVAREVAAKKPMLAMKAGRTIRRRQGRRLPYRRTGQRRSGDRPDFQKSRYAHLHGRRRADPGGRRVCLPTHPQGKPGWHHHQHRRTGGHRHRYYGRRRFEHPAPFRKDRSFLKESLFPEASVNNPVDVLATGNAAHYRACLDAMMADDNFDAVFFNFVTPFFVDTDSIAREIAAVNQRKPMVCNLMTDKRQWTETVRILKEGGVPCFSLPGEAARAMTALARYSASAPGYRPVDTFDDVDKSRAQGIIDKASAAGHNFLPAADVYEILEPTRFPPAGAWPRSGRSGRSCRGIGFPVVVKADAAAIVHKSDMGGVAVNLRIAQCRAGGCQGYAGTFDAPDLKFFVQKYVPGGMEVILGAKAERVWAIRSCSAWAASLWKS